MDARRVIVGPVRPSAAQEEDATDRPWAIHAGLARPVDVHPLEGLVARRADEPLVEAAPGVIIEVTTGQVPATKTKLEPTFRVTGQGGPRQEEADELVLPRPARLEVRETVRPTAAQVVVALHAERQIGLREGLTGERRVGRRRVMATDVEAALAIGPAGTGGRDGGSRGSSATTGTPAKGVVVGADPSTSSGRPGLGLAPDGPCPRRVDRCQTDGRPLQLRRPRVAILANHFRKTAKAGDGTPSPEKRRHYPELKSEQAWRYLPLYLTEAAQSERIRSSS